MKNFKKVIAGALALLMLALSVNVSFAAEEYTDKEAVVVAKVNAAGIMQGTDKGFEPTKTLTRAEAAAIFVRMKGISEATVKQNNGTTLFTDVAASHWAAGYINVASNYGIIKGVGANKFAPEKEVSVAEFYTMAIRALNAGQLVDAEGTWPTNYVNFAIENDLAEDVAQVYTATATRMTAATIAANTLEAKMWKKSGYNTKGEIDFAPTDNTILGSVLNITDAYSTGATTSIKSVKVAAVSKKDNEITYGTDSTLECAETCDLSNIKVGMTYEFWVNDDNEVIGLWLPKTSDAVEFTEIKKFTAGATDELDKVKLVVNGKEKEYELADGYTTYVNEDTNSTFVAGAADSAISGIKGYAYLDSEDNIDLIYITNFTKYAVIKEVSDKKVTFKTNSDIIGEVTGSITLNTKDGEYFLTNNGKAMKFTDLEEDDVIRYYQIGKKTVAEVVESVATGKVTSVIKNTDTTKLDSFKVSGKSYDFKAPLLVSGQNSESFAIGDEITVYTNDAGKVVLTIKDKEADPDYGLVAYARKVTNRYGETAEVKFLLPSGDLTEAYEIDLKDDDMYADDQTADDIVALLGTVVDFKVKGDNQVVIKTATSTSSEELEGYALKANNKNIKITKDGETTLFVTEDTKVLKLKADGTKDYSFKVEEIAVEDLDTIAFNSASDKFHSYAGKIDTDTHVIDVLYVGVDDTVGRTTEANFSFITKVWEEEDEDDKSVLSIDLIYADGSKDTAIIDDNTTFVGTTKAAVKPGTYFDIAIKDGKVLTVDICVGKLAPVTGDKYIVKSVTDHRYDLSTSKDLYVSDEVLVLKANKAAASATKWEVSSLDSIRNYENDADYKNTDYDDVDTLTTVYKYAEEDGDEEEVVLVVYYVNDGAAASR